MRNQLASHWRTVAQILVVIALLLHDRLPAFAAADKAVLPSPPSSLDSVTIAASGRDTVILVDTNDYEVVRLAAGFFADDLGRVCGRRAVVTNAPATAAHLVIAGTLGHSAPIDRLAKSGKLKGLDKLRNAWEATLCQVVEDPFPGAGRALVIAGSDRRGAAYGLMQISEKIGVSPWYWWADVPVKHQETVTIQVPAPSVDFPAVRYRGIFINDEDWGLFPWAKQTFDPEFGNIGPKTYEKVFELMLRLRLNYIWPAMHECTREFHLVPENLRLAARYGIVMGATHCEPMLFNNAKWNENERGKWDYTLNRSNILSVWENEARTRGHEEAVWTLGIRGIHDRGMQGPKDIPTRISIVSNVFNDQVALLDKYTGKEWGPVASAFVPYKEVLTLYDAGLKPPADTTLVWVDDNFGYIRRLSNLEERARPGGSGVYCHASYYGAPHSYLWINTAAPALIWEELHKAWENDARKLWVLNVGDIKPMEISIDFFARFAWDAPGFGPNCQPRFLRDFVEKNFGRELAEPVSGFLGEFFRLGTIRKPELMTRAWALGLPDGRAGELRQNYENLLQREARIAAAMPAEARDAWFEMIGFPARVMAGTGLIFMADREAQLGRNAATNEARIKRLRGFLDDQVARFNNDVAGGKWKRMMPGANTGKYLTAWNSQVRWPWGESAKPGATTPTVPARADRAWRDAAAADRRTGSTTGTARWEPVAGLGASGRALALKPATPDFSWQAGDSAAPGLEFDFTTQGGDFEALVDFLPTFRLYPGLQLRVAASVDGQAETVAEVPGSSGKDDERGTSRAEAVQNNCARLSVPLPGLAAGKHTFRIRAMDPGVVIDRVSLP